MDPIESTKKKMAYAIRRLFKTALLTTALFAAGSVCAWGVMDFVVSDEIRAMRYSDRGMWMNPNTPDHSNMNTDVREVPSFVDRSVVEEAHAAKPVESNRDVLDKPLRVGVQLEFYNYQNGTPLLSTQEHLIERFGNGKIVFEKLNASELEAAVLSGSVDFVIVDGGFFTRYETTDGLKSLASLWPLEAPDPAFAVGSLFISRAGNDSIDRPSDFVGKQIGAFYPQSYTGFLIGMRELYRQGVVVQALKNRITYFGDDPLAIAHAVENKMVDVGIIPTCSFERMVNAGQIERVKYRLVGTKSSGLIHCAHSTDLYPSWYFAALKSVDGNQRRMVSASLLTMTTAADGADWSLSANNREVHDLFFDLKIGPYANLAAWQFTTFAKEQATTVSIVVSICLVIILYAGSLSVLVRRRTKLLKEALADRDRIEKLANASRDHIANLERTGIVGQMSTMIAHELKQPLGAITNFANGLLRRSKRGAIDPEVLNQVLAEIVDQGERASEIVNRVRAYAKHQTPELKMADMSVSVERAIETFKRSRRTDAAISVSLMPYLWADIDGWEIELAVLNLLKNAADALEDTDDAQIHVRVKPEDRFWRIEVSDNGPKTTQEAVDKFMLPLVTSKEGGLGLGISIVGNIAERHHGRLIATANQQEGVTMALDIPRSVMPEHTAM